MNERRSGKDRRIGPRRRAEMNVSGYGVQARLSGGSLMVAFFAGLAVGVLGSLALTIVLVIWAT